MSWRKVKLGELLDNFSVRAKDIGGAKDMEFFGVSNVEGIIKTKYAAEEKAEDYKIIEKDCFAYNPYRINVGSIGLVTEDIRGLISPAYVVFKPKPKSIRAELLLKFLKSSEGLRQIKFYARGTVRQALRFEDLCNIELSLPDYHEQEILFKRLNLTQTESDLLGTELTRQLDFIKQLRKSLLRDSMEGKLIMQDINDEPAIELLKKIRSEKQKLIAEKKLKKEKALLAIKQEEIPFEIPKNWVWCRLGELAILNGRIGWKGLSANEYKNAGPLFLSVHSLNYGDYVDYTQAFHISQERYTESPEIMLQENDILICKDGAGIGKLGIIKNLEEPASINSSLLLIRCYKHLNIKFVYYYLLSAHFQKIVNAKIMGATTPHLYQRDLVNFLIALPPISEQIRIVTNLEHLMHNCDAFEQAIKESRGLNENILQKVLKEVMGFKSTIKIEDDKSSKLLYKKFSTDENQNFIRINMKIIEILHNEQEPIPASVVWKSSEYSDDIEKFYAELKKLVDIKKVVVEKRIGKESYLKLATNEN
jgi:type I restriction enzyme, S subunit